MTANTANTAYEFLTKQYKLNDKGEPVFELIPAKMNEEYYDEVDTCGCGCQSSAGCPDPKDGDKK